MDAVPRYQVVEFPASALQDRLSRDALASVLEAYAVDGWRLVSLFPWSGPDAQAGDAMVQALSQRLRLVCVLTNGLAR